MNKFALELDSVVRRFGRVQALQGLSFQIPEKAVAALVGANGAGKTTTFSVIGQFIRTHGGSVKVFGYPLPRFRKLGGIIGLLPQDMKYFEDRTVERQLYLFARLAGMSKSDSYDEVERVLGLVKLTDKARAKAGDLSHGMAVRLGVAQALIANPPLVLLDEPTAGLDPRMIVEFRETVEAIRGKTTLVISSHNLGELEELCDYCCMIDRGKLLKQGPMSQLLSGGVLSMQFRVEKIMGDIRQLEEQLPAADVVVEGQQTLLVEFDRKRYRIADVNRIVIAWILNNGMEVLEVQQKRSLEQAFLEATGH